MTPPDQACVTTIASMKTLKECKMVIMCFLFMNILSLPVSSASRQGNDRIPHDRIPNDFGSFAGESNSNEIRLMNGLFMRFLIYN